MSNGLVSASLARGLARNPLGVIALFLFLIYGLATLAFSVNTLTPQERWPLVWFLVLFPLIVLATFAWLVSSHHEKLYAPSDYRDDEGFHRSTVARHQYLKELERQNVHLKARVGEAVREQFEKDGPRLEGAMQGISEAIDRGTSIYVDMTAVSGTDVMSVSFPIAAFETFGDLTDAVYYELEDIVGAFEYGHSWVLRNKDSGRIIKSARMITGAAPGSRVPDKRSLSDVGIEPGANLQVELLRKKTGSDPLNFA